ncbi:MAG: response regulator [Lachnospiraceae bacterium]|nr:response regulator [Lachnospiraceae bacterium]
MKNKTTILIIEDEETILNFMSAVLDSNDYRVLKAREGREALSIAASRCPDIILLDLGLPDIDGMEVLHSLREWSQIPIIVISARTLETEKVAALDAGADDYITKPFGTSELLARIRTAIRHSRKTSGTDAGTACCKIKDLVLDFDRHTVTLAGKDIHLTQIEFRILELLAQNAGRVLTYDTIITKIWGPYADSNNRILRVNMANIRRKLEQNPADPEYIFTEIGIGYRMAEDE